MAFAPELSFVVACPTGSRTHTTDNHKGEDVAAARGVDLPPPARATLREPAAEEATAEEGREQAAPHEEEGERKQVAHEQRDCVIV